MEVQKSMRVKQLKKAILLKLDMEGQANVKLYVGGEELEDEKKPIKDIFNLEK